MLAKPNISTNMGYPGLVIAYGANSAQNAMMACTNSPRNTLPRAFGTQQETDIISHSRRVEERSSQPLRQAGRQQGSLNYAYT